MLEEIREMDIPEFEEPIDSDWAVLEAKLGRLGLSKDIIEEESFFINDYISQGYEEATGDGVLEPLPDYSGSQAPTKSEKAQEDNLPDYSPEEQFSAAEKAGGMDQATKNRTIKNVEDASSSAALPPPYVFEDGSNNDLMDTEFSQIIQNAIEVESHHRIAHREQFPSLGPHPYSWLPPHLQPRYIYRRDMIEMTAGDSFTAMAYETGPRCANEVGRLRLLLGTSFELKSEKSSEVQQALELISRALTKFNLLQDQDSASGNFSDLDTIDYKFSTAIVIGDFGYGPFPEADFEQSRKSYYSLLTFIMGFLQVMSNIFPGRTYISRSLEECDLTWQSNKMNTRVAWIEKRMAAWNEIEHCVRHCRDWYLQRPAIHRNAIVALEDWHNTQKVLSGVNAHDMVELTILAGANLPRSSFRTPTPLVKLVLYGINSFGNTQRMIELETRVSAKTQFPSWNQIFQLEPQNNTRMVDLEVIDRVAGIDMEICRKRLEFNFNPGVEATFFNKSLMFGYDEELDLPMVVNGGKGKEIEAPTLRIRLRWTGRIAKVKELGFLTTPPGKMFRNDTSMVPLGPEELGLPKLDTSKPSLFREIRAHENDYARHPTRRPSDIAGIVSDKKGA
ncbi:hypothetical protein BGZ60DRAFT_251583 [Tricladium varicosporioides]|nr:hypothetical protein BGZ60DRAFT_251583 [Hymenoscyphus varicosporioides]